jgi:hypothetical protein
MMSSATPSSSDGTGAFSSGTAGVKIFLHVQEELVEKSDLLRGDQEGIYRIIGGLEAV